jgi:hypothetical protein
VRDELLNSELFTCLAEAKMLSTQWRLEYNHRRPHSSLGYVAPAVFAASWGAEAGQEVAPGGCDACELANLNVNLKGQTPNNFKKVKTAKITDGTFVSFENAVAMGRDNDGRARRPAST